MMRTSAITIAVLATALASCGGGGSDDADTAAPPASAEADAVESEPEATDDSADEPDDPAPDATTPADTAAPATDPPTTDAPVVTAPALVPQAPRIDLLTESAAAGTQPELAWSAIDDAVTYRVVVLDADGAPYWAWSGPETSVFLGGGSSSDGAGPSVAAGFTWTVTALDADRGFLASSGVGELGN